MGFDRIQVESPFIVSLDPKIKEFFTWLYEVSNDPNQPIEIPFFLLGHQIPVEGKNIILLETFVHDTDNLKAYSARPSLTLVTWAMNLIREHGYSVILHGHSHPVAIAPLEPGSERHYLTQYLASIPREELQYRTSGLNFSLADLYSVIHNYYMQANFERTGISGIYLPNGEFNILTYNEGYLSMVQEMFYDEGETLLPAKRFTLTKGGNYGKL